MFEKFRSLFSGKSQEPEKKEERKTDPVDHAKVRESAAVNRKVNDEKVETKTDHSSGERAVLQQEGKVKDRQEEAELRLSSDPIRNQKEDSWEGGRRKKSDASRSFYRYLNQAIKTMHIAYSENRFDDLTHLGKIPAQVTEEYEQILDRLSEDLQAWLSALRAMVVLREEEGAAYVDIADKEGLKRELLNAMLPFYGIYADKLNEGRVRFSALIGPEMLRLFHELTGKKFSVGFHRRYESGINAFEMENDRYQVYDSKGHLLCDAVFKDGQVETGFAELAEPDPDYEDWEIVKAGQWDHGQFQSGAQRYVYKISVQ